MASQESSTDENERLGRLSALRRNCPRIGVALILLSGVFFGSMFVVPFLPLSVGAKVLLAGGLYIGMQIAWWAGVALAGSVAIGKMKSSMSRYLPRSRSAEKHR